MQNSGPRTRKYIYILWWWSTELAWLYSASPHNAAYLGPHLIFPSSCGGLSKISMQSLHYYYSRNNAIRQSHSPTRSLGRSVGRSISHLSTHRRRRNKAVASCYVTWLASAKYTLDHAQPFGRGTCKKKWLWQATAVLQGSALTKIAGGHFGEPPLWAIRCLFTVSPRAAGDTGQVIKSRKEPLAKA